MAVNLFNIFNEGSKYKLKKDNKDIEVGHIVSSEGENNVDLPNYEAKLSIDSNPIFDISMKTPEPVMADFSILDKDIKELVSMDRSVVRDVLLKEILEIKDWPRPKRNDQLQKIFGKIIDLAPEHHIDFLADNIHCHSLFVDLISIPELSKLPFVYNFLKHDFSVTTSRRSDLKREMIISIFDYYETHSQEAIEVFNYILKSSSSVALSILGKKNYDFEKFFSERIL